MENKLFQSKDQEDIFLAEISDLSWRLHQVLSHISNDKGEVLYTLEDIGRFMPRKGGKCMDKSSVSRAIIELKNAGFVDSVKGRIIVKRSLLINEQQNRVIKPRIEESPVNRPEFRSLSNDQQKQPKQPEIEDPLSNEQQESETVNLPPQTPPSSNSYILNNNNNNINKTNTNLSARLKGDENEKPGDEKFTQKHYPGAPCTVEFARHYFEGYFDRHSMEDVDPYQTALAFMDHWDPKEWMYRRAKEKFATRIDESRVKRHLATWATNVRKGTYQRFSRPTKTGGDTGSKERTGGRIEIHPWLNYDQLLKHGQFNGLAKEGTRWIEKYYELDKSLGKPRWRYIGKLPIKFTYGNVLTVDEVI